MLEALLFSARLRVPPGVLAGAAIRAYVEEVMQVGGGEEEGWGGG